MKQGITVNLLILGLFIGFSCKAYAYDNGDFQVWNTDIEEWKINDSSKLALEEEFRWGDNANQLYYHHYDIAFIYALNKKLDVGLSYRHIYERKKGKFRIENEPNINVTYKWEFVGFKFSDRNRFEYRHFSYQTDSFRYRNMLTIRFPWKFTRLEIQIYLADDIFISSIGTAFNNNRFYSGLSFNLTKNLKGEVYYLLQHTRTVSKKSTDWPHVNVFGTKLKILF